MTDTVMASVAPRNSAGRDDHFDLLCACTLTNPAPEQVARIAGWTWDEFDWDTFLQLAEHHGVLALVAFNLNKYARNLPEQIVRSLDSSYHTNLKRNLWFASELSRILEHFTRNQIRAAPYKGPVLAEAAYGDLALRRFSDLDLLISAADFDRAKRALGEIGYRPSEELSPAVERFWLRTGYERSFDGEAGKNLVELQWNLLPYFYAVDAPAGQCGTEDLVSHAGTLELGESWVPCLSPEDSLLALCLHAAKHLWARLIWVADIAGSLHAPGLDFSALAARARSLGIARMMGISFRLVEKLLGVALPEAARLLVARDPAELKLADEFGQRLRQGASYDFESAAYFRTIAALRERPADRWRYYWRLVWTPGSGEIATFKLPEPLFPLYRAARIGRLLRKLF